MIQIEDVTLVKIIAVRSPPVEQHSSVVSVRS